MTQPTTPRIVVGYDGSRYADAALAWAVNYAKGCDGDLELVTVWQWPMTFGYPLNLGDYSPENDAARILADAAKTCGLPDSRVHTKLLEGPAAALLVDRSRGATALVVGTHGHNDFSGLVLGSVSNYCTHHAGCTLVVVRAPSRSDALGLESSP